MPKFVVPMWCIFPAFRRSPISDRVSSKPGTLRFHHWSCNRSNRGRFNSLSERSTEATIVALLGAEPVTGAVYLV